MVNQVSALGGHARLAAGYNNQCHRSHAPAAARLERQLAPALPTHQYLARGPMYRNAEVNASYRAPACPDGL